MVSTTLTRVLFSISNTTFASPRSTSFPPFPHLLRHRRYGTASVRRTISSFEAIRPLLDVIPTCHRHQPSYFHVIFYPSAVVCASHPLLFQQICVTIKLRHCFLPHHCTIRAIGDSRPVISSVARSPAERVRRAWRGVCPGRQSAGDPDERCRESDHACVCGKGVD